ncbi:unnamed protein product (macronuclear) [Paramecium tetraurelia]|uniref:Uncharacterized protein n=1 Tax=Paramecium tetraurelia TaxID=5888 RepID=A0DLW3_PARTE|nr:uncharacterized protein GSPATT00039663001 [Paramecium tetraurelia]CAK84030.1 unnamed protein product [Paramecium tetraurelia]|eukprot:XP_001451427.1 hypothetical protein (macronuclear) [Paramecium tetraurelia strain d4-2]
MLSYSGELYNKEGLINGNQTVLSDKFLDNSQVTHSGEYKMVNKSVLGYFCNRQFSWVIIFVDFNLNQFIGGGESYYDEGSMKNVTYYNHYKYGGRWKFCKGKMVVTLLNISKFKNSQYISNGGLCDEREQIKIGKI